MQAVHKVFVLVTGFHIVHDLSRWKSLRKTGYYLFFVELARRYHPQLDNTNFTRLSLSMLVQNSQHLVSPAFRCPPCHHTVGIASNSRARANGYQQKLENRVRGDGSNGRPQPRHDRRTGHAWGTFTIPLGVSLTFSAVL